MSKKGRLVNTVTASFTTITRQMTEMPQRKKTNAASSMSLSRCLPCVITTRDWNCRTSNRFWPTSAARTWTPTIWRSVCIPPSLTSPWTSNATSWSRWRSKQRKLRICRNADWRLVCMASSRQRNSMFKPRHHRCPRSNSQFCDQ